MDIKNKSRIVRIISEPMEDSCGGDNGKNIIVEPMPVDDRVRKSSTFDFALGRKVEEGDINPLAKSDLVFGRMHKRCIGGERAADRTRRVRCGENDEGGGSRLTSCITDGDIMV